MEPFTENLFPLLEKIFRAGKPFPLKDALNIHNDALIFIQTDALNVHNDALIFIQLDATKHSNMSIKHTNDALTEVDAATTIVNIGATEVDDVVDLKINTRVGEILPWVLKRLGVSDDICDLEQKKC
ncbi:hypothetical protein Tco_1058530 [Tanacetum coccineum]|uniref:SCP2 domain-containing protein n=1 Tax=Tanacetum coccineum TaxID=301880 RepID=A0ABQ5HAJ3_9ASTR